MRDRLIELIAEISKKARYIVIDECREKVADYLLENGVIVPPCKVGDTVYKVINDKRVKKPYECKVVGFWYSEAENCNSVHLVRYVNGTFDRSYGVPFIDFGKTVFLTREAAENALKERVQG